MSVALAVVTASPTVAQHPVVDTIVKYVTTNHTQVVAAATTLLGTALGTGATLLHGILLRDKLSKVFNEALALVYVAALVALDLFVTGQLNSSLTFGAVAQVYLTILGANQGVYMLLHLYSASTTSSSTVGATLPVTPNV